MFFILAPTTLPTCPCMHAPRTRTRLCVCLHAPVFFVHAQAYLTCRLDDVMMLTPSAFMCFVAPPMHKTNYWPRVRNLIIGLFAAARGPEAAFIVHSLAVRVGQRGVGAGPVRLRE